MFNPGERSQPIGFCTFLLVACLLLSGISSAAPTITLSKKSGPPTSPILISGRGFQANVGVDVYFDTKDEALVVTNGEGEFHNARAYAPRSAHPGEHWVTALERNDDKAAQKPFLVQTDWAEFHFDVDRKGLNPYENVLNPRTVRDIDLKWSYAVGSAVDSSPAVVDGRIHFGSYDSVTGLNTVYALDAGTGALLWSHVTGPSTRSSLSSPAVANGVVYIGSNDYNLYALNASTGALLWSFSTGWYVERSPAVVDGAVYIGSDIGAVFALDATTGAQLWEFFANDIVRSTPAVKNGVVYVGSDDGNLYALSARTGALLWSYPTGSLESAPAVVDGVVYVGSGDAFYAVSATTGTLAWKDTIGGYISASSPAVANGVVYFGATNGAYALNASTGKLLWKNPNGGDSSPAVANGVVYFGASNNNMNAVDARTGAQLWSYTTGNYVYSSPAIANGILYVGSEDGNVYAFGLLDGDQVKEEATSKRPGLRTLHPDFSLKISSGSSQRRARNSNTYQDN
jgi:outer membrane protein assembly factor BamB